ncbi:MAG TPA: SLC13 family permease [Candidatus Kapabacteria bacterium]|nr:SLC13 family permease [Candidatus Kapabacteria bacterium]
MTWEIGLLLGIIAVAVILFSLERFSPDVIGLGLVVLLAVTGLLPKDRAFEGFGSDTVITILGLLILTAALLRTGVMDIVSRIILKHTGENPLRLLIVIMCTAAGLSAFISNTAATAFFIPLVIGIAERAKISPSKLLMPLAFSSIITSSVTLISTSTNLVVSGLMTQADLAPMGMFELSPVGIPIAIVGLLYMFFIGRRLIPDRSRPGDLIGDFGMRPYLSELVILPSSTFIGKTLENAAFRRDFDLNVIQIIRNKKELLLPKPDLPLQEGDVLLVKGKTEHLLKIKDTAGIDIKADLKLSEPALEGKGATLVEVILMPKSPLIGRTLKGYRFRERYGLQVLGMNRHGENIQRKLSQAPLRMGDVLLLQGQPENISALENENVVKVLTAIREERPNRARASRAILIFMGVIVLGTIKVGGAPLLSFPLAMILGSVLVFSTKCITPEEAYREVEWKAVILIGSMLALGVAMQETGTAAYLAGQITEYAGNAGPFWLLTGFFVLTVVLTQPMSNQAAAAVILPVAIQTAIQLGMNPRTFAMMIAVAASCSYLTPLEPSCLMVYGPGRYKFVDFLKVGSLLTVLIYIIAILLVPRVWPLTAAKGAVGPATQLQGTQ